MQPDNLIPRHAWWDSRALEDAVASFAPTMMKLVREAYQRAGSPYGDSDDDRLERWVENFRGTEAGEALERAIGDAWAFHLQVCFAARQVN